MHVQMHVQIRGWVQNETIVLKCNVVHEVLQIVLIHITEAVLLSKTEVIITNVHLVREAVAHTIVAIHVREAVVHIVARVHRVEAIQEVRALRQVAVHQAVLMAEDDNV